MIPHPIPAPWFEALVAQDDASRALAALAHTGAVELELQAGGAERARVDTLLREPLAQYEALARRYADYWPVEGLQCSAVNGSPVALLNDGLARLLAWAREADPLIRHLQALEHRVTELRMLRELFVRFRWSPIDFGLLAHPGAVLRRRLFLMPAQSALAVPPQVLAIRVPLQERHCLLAIGHEAAVAQLQHQVTGLKGQVLRLPGWVRGAGAGNLARAEARLAERERELAQARDELESLHRRHGLHTALGDLEHLRWFARHVRALPATTNFAWITGWTSDPDGAKLNRALLAAGIRGLVHLSAPPAGATPPLLLRNPWWARPFEPLAAALGMPDAREVDASRLLALLFPLMFGYMFGDVGQGMVLLVAGLALRRRWPIAGLVAAGGLSAMVFGLLFGTAFCSESLLPALWMHPLQQPMRTLEVPLLGGAAILVLGLILNGVQTHWHGDLRRWLYSGAGIVPLYIGLLAAPFARLGAPLALVGFAWYAIGRVHLERRAIAVLHALADLLETLFQLAVNTLSFARVGAFALAHAGLSLAVVTLAQASGHPVFAWAIMAIGNLVILLLEGLVVTVQATRLVLFEFFVRFLHGGGRAFAPLPAPDLTVQRRTA